MGKPHRLDYDGAYHHVYNRGARRDLIFLDDTDRRLWLGILVDVCAKREVQIHAYCLMGNHFHLILRSRGNVSVVMRDVGSRYVRSFNRRHGLDGPLHRSSFENEIIESDDYFRTASRYVHRNPAEIWAGPLEHYQWSSYGAYLSSGPAPHWLTTSVTLALFDNDRRRYREFVSGGERAPLSPWTPEVDLMVGPQVPLHEVIRVVAALVGVEPSTLVAGRPGVRSPGRLAVCLLAQEFEIGPEATAFALGYASSDSIRTSLHRGRKLLEKDGAFVALLEVARRRLFGRGKLDAAAAA